jgi:site-specific DNA recombinase
MRCAIYARYSSDLQRDSSIDDQIRQCREYARAKGWSVVEQFVRSDRAMSAGSTTGRTSLDQLLKDAERHSRSFDCLLVDDTSRLARNLEDSLRIVKTLEFFGVNFCSVSQNLNSGDKSARSLLTLHGMMDEQFLVGLAEKVHRGQEGQVRKGLQAGGRCYGYRNVPIEDPTRVEKYGRPAVIGVRLEIKDDEAAIVRRIFDSYAAGMGLARIAKMLNSEGVPAPQTPRTRELRAWCISSLHEMLRNERYRGVYVWNRTEKKRSPKTGRKVSRPRPESEWVRADAPGWRIVTDQQWTAVVDRIRSFRDALSSNVVGGMNRTAQSCTYLFSGLLTCSRCNARMVIIGGGKRGYIKYGCPSHRYKGVCNNRLTIRRDRLETQLLDALERKLLRNDMADYLATRFEEEANKRIREWEREDHVSVRAGLIKRRDELKAKERRICDAIAQGNSPESLIAYLKELESEIAQISQRLTTKKPVEARLAPVNMRQFALEKVLHLRDMLHSDNIPAARLVLQKHIGRLIMTPTLKEGKPVYEVSGKVDLAPMGGKGVMEMVAREGLEPPTPAFSGLRSTN